MLTPDQARARVSAALERAALAHKAGRYAELRDCLEAVDEPEVRVGGTDGEQIGFALRFLDGWVDASEHDWQYYEGIGQDAWPEFARVMAATVRTGATLQWPRTLERFMDRRYCVTFASMAGLVAVAAVFLVSGICVGLLAPSRPVLAVAGLPLALVVAARFRLCLSLSPQSVSHRGLFVTRRVSLGEIRWAGWKNPTGWVASRFHGPFVYELRTSGQRLRVNLKLFPRACSADLLALVPPSD